MLDHDVYKTLSVFDELQLLEPVRAQCISACVCVLCVHALRGSWQVNELSNRPADCRSPLINRRLGCLSTQLSGPLNSQSQVV